MSRKSKGNGQIQGEGDYRSARHFNKASRQFVETHDVERLGREAAPRSAAESADMKRAESKGRARARGKAPARNRRSPAK